MQPAPEKTASALLLTGGFLYNSPLHLREERGNLKISEKSAGCIYTDKRMLPVMLTNSLQSLLDKCSKAETLNFFFLI